MQVGKESSWGMEFYFLPMKNLKQTLKQTNERLSAKLNFRKCKCLLSGYRLSQKDQHYCDFIEKAYGVNASHNKIVLVGDFNLE